MAGPHGMVLTAKAYMGSSTVLLTLPIMWTPMMMTRPCLVKVLVDDFGIDGNATVHLTFSVMKKLM